MDNNFKYKLIDRLFHFLGHLSLPNRLRLGAALTRLAPLLMRKRIKVVKKNLELCFPEATATQRRQWQRQHIRTLCQSIIDRGLIWYGPPETIREQVHLHNFHYIQEAIERREPLLVLGPHFVGLDVAASRMTMEIDETATIYKAQRNAVFDAIIRKGRARFNQVNLINRKDGVRGMLKFLRRGVPVYYLPDMDFGRQGSIFVPFFGVPAATLPTTAVLASKWQATVIPVVSRWDPDTGHYHIEVQPPLQDFPGEQSIEDATARLNSLLEDWIRRDPPQYYWVHRRFKTRPDPEAPRYY